VEVYCRQDGQRCRCGRAFSLCKRSIPRGAKVKTPEVRGFTWNSTGARFAVIPSATELAVTRNVDEAVSGSSRKRRASSVAFNHRRAFDHRCSLKLKGARGEPFHVELHWCAAMPTAAGEVNQGPSVWSNAGNSREAVPRGTLPMPSGQACQARTALQHCRAVNRGRSVEIKDRGNHGFQVTLPLRASQPCHAKAPGTTSVQAHPPSVRLETHVDLCTSLVRGSQINIQNSHSGGGDPGDAARLPKRCRPHAFQLFADFA
jgi:hypothetical protein